VHPARVHNVNGTRSNTPRSTFRTDTVLDVDTPPAH
jgi:hypothetical protein